MSTAVAIADTAPAASLPADPMQRMVLAEKLANARLIPSHFQKSPADVWLVMTFCQKRNLDFFMVVGECNVVKGRLFFSGKLTAALLNTSGYLADRLNYEYSGEGDNRAVTVTARLMNEASPRSVLVKIKDVRTDNENWKKQPDQQLAYSGARIWGRRHMPEVLMGLMFEGETIDVTPTVIRTHDAPALDATDLPTEEKPAAEKPEPTQDAAQPFDITRDDNSPESWSLWGKTLMAYIRSCSTADQINDWLIANADSLHALKEYDVEKFNVLFNWINKQVDARAQ